MHETVPGGPPRQAGNAIPAAADPAQPDSAAADLARYRAECSVDAAFDACGLPVAGYYDELADTEGGMRPVWAPLSADFVEPGSAGLAALDRRVRRLVDDDGITYTDVGGEVTDEEPTAPVPWRLDPIPLPVAAAEWARLEAGLVQRARVLDAVLADVYGPRRLLGSGVLPPEIVFGSIGYLRAAHGISVPGRHQLFLLGCDVSRWADGGFRVLTDWAQAPSGVGYALADRRVVSAAIPAAFEHAGPRPLTPFARAMRLMLIEAAPPGTDDPLVVVLSPGAHSETAFDQAYVASVLGFPLVESADLVVRDGALWMRSLGTLRRVDVVLRRVDAAFSDPLDLRPDSKLGVVGLVEVLRRGAVTVVNTLGSGLLESPALAAVLPRVARAVTGEELELPGAPAFWGGIDSDRSHLLARLDRLILRSAVDGTTYFGPALSEREREELRARIEYQGRDWVGQEPPQFSVAPAVGGGGLTAAPVGMRLFALAGRAGYRALPGGVGQLHARLPADRSVVKVGAKDIWVRTAPATVAAVGTEAAPERVRATSADPVLDAVSSPRVLTDLFWLGRYAERAEATVRLLAAVHERYRDYRYRPWLEGAEAVPVLIGALARVTGIAAGDTDPTGVSAADHDYLVRVTLDRELPGSLAYALDRYGANARAVRDQLPTDTWMVLGAVDRALAGHRPADADAESELPVLHSTILSALLALSGIDAETMVRDIGWCVTDIGRRIERGLITTEILAQTLTRELPEPVQRMVTEGVLRATESSVSYRRRHRDSIRVAAVAGLLLFDAANPRSLAYQLDRLETDLRALPGISGSSWAQRLLTDIQRLLRRLDPADVEIVDINGRRSEFAVLLDGVQSGLRRLSESLETSRLSGPGAIQPLWGNTVVVS